MLHALAKRVAVFLFDEDDKYPVEVYIYGIELLISSLIGNLLVLIVGIVSGYFLESVIFMVSLSAIRFFSGGYHAKTYLWCDTVYLISYALTMLFYKLVMCGLGYGVYAFAGALIVITAVIMIMFAPVENENKKIDEKSKKKFKIISVSLSIVELSAALLLFALFDFEQALVVFPTVAVVDIAMIAELCIRRKKNEKN